VFARQVYPLYTYNYRWEEARSQETGNQDYPAQRTEEPVDDAKDEPGTCSHREAGVKAAEDDQKPSARITNNNIVEPPRRPADTLEDDKKPTARGDISLDSLLAQL